MNIAIYSFFLTAILMLSAIPSSIADVQNNFISVNSATLEGNVMTPQKVSPYLNYYEVDYVTTESNTDFIVIFSPSAKPLESSITPYANCVELTTQFCFIFFRIDGYSCNFGSVSQGTELSIQFENTANPLNNIFNFGV